MFEMIRQLSEKSMEGTRVIHEMMNAAVGITVAAFPDSADSIRMTTDGVILCDVNDRYTIKITRTFNPFMVKVEVMYHPNSIIVAECLLSSDGSFKETYVRFPDGAIREKIGSYFVELSTIEVPVSKSEIADVEARDQEESTDNVKVDEVVEADIV